MSKKIFGSSDEEASIEDNIRAREIVQTVLDYGVNQEQIMQMIYLLALELENMNTVKQITSIIKSNKQADQPKNSIITGG
ncbi:MAG: hypothetical protein CBC29_05920 [Methylococcaceae bacterium TMED69]|nr:MAG: hypothetical protein CBC29_05920 [Methylococcaceae bacterium TMED69]|tara:strand:- start:1546 stop:1785 length:240 start_codon:yes stop_codon:yes gene_type:complete